MKKLSDGKIIIGGDSHQTLAFLDAIIAKEEPFDKFVHLGDHLDTSKTIDNNIVYNVKETCRWINEKLDDNRFIWLLGNHDLAYLASYTPNLIPPKGSFYSCSGWTRNKAKEFNRHINTDWFKKIELCCKIGDYYCVHGGFSYRQFKPYMSAEDNIEDMYNEWEKDKLTFMHKPWHWINYVGPARYGMDEYSSPIWLDFNREFVPLDEISQLVGHTNQPFPSIRNKQNPIGLNNYCIDCSQICYAVWEDGNLEIKFLTDKDYPIFLSP
jgi:hypothetical protein